MGVRKIASERKAGVAAVASKPQLVTEKAAENEIDAIFGKKKKRRTIAAENEETVAEDGTGSIASSQKKKKVRTRVPPADDERRRKAGKQSKGGKVGKSESSAVELISKSRKKTADGLTVYGEDELKWSSKDAGGTPLCPFDCECCF